MLSSRLPFYLQYLIGELNFPKAILIDFIHFNSNRSLTPIRMSVKDFHKELSFISENTIYRSLKELENDGLIESDFSGMFDRTKVYKLSTFAIENYYAAPNSLEEYYSKSTLENEYNKF